MDSSAPNGSHQQDRQNGTNFNHLFDGIQDYPFASDDFMYDAAFYPPNSEQPPAFSHQPIVSDPSWNQNALQQQPSDPGINSYGTLQNTYQNQPYNQPPFQFVPPTYDPRTMSRPSPSPGPYSSYQFQTPMTYGGGDPSLAPSQSFHQQQSLAQQRSPSIQTTTFPAQQPHGPYFNYGARPGLQQNLQGVNLSNFSSYSEPGSRPANTFIDPSFLTANGVAVSQPDQYNASLHRPDSRQASVASTSHLGVPSHGLTQTLQPILQNKVSIHDNSSGQSDPSMAPKPVKAPAKPRKPKDPNAPKRPRGRPRKDGTLPRVKQEGKSPPSSYDSESDSDLEIEEPPEPMPEILKNDRPNDFDGKVLFDTVQAVWFPRNKLAVPDNIRAGIAQFGETIRKLRDAWKAKNAALQQAENANSSNVPILKEEVGQYRRLMQNVAKTAVELGHPAHLKKLGENVFTLSALQAVLLDRFNAGDYNGSLVTAILTLVTEFETVDQEMLETAKMAKILVRLTKKADNECKTLAQKILENAVAASKEKSSKSKLEGPQSPASVNGTTKPSQGSSPQVAIPPPQGPVTAVAGVKRPRETEGGIPSATKRTTVPPSSRPVVQASKPIALQAAERKRVDAAASSAKASDSIMNGAVNAPAGKPKGTVVAPSKPATSVFSTLVSASKKPGTSIAARAAAAKDKPSPSTVVKKESPPPAPAPAAPPKSSFSFMDTLADMSKTKEAEPKKIDDRPPETEEERTKRLRKEERRKLRVSWRPEDSLVEIRIFTHDPEEEIGQTDSMMRDVTDIGGEGRMLKLHRDLNDLDDDEETQATGEDLEPYVFPSEIDFDELESHIRMQNFIKYGGTQKPESPESEAQARREENTLMVVYTLPSEVPPSPKEPPAPSDDEEYTPLTSFGSPNEQTRSREAKYLTELQARQPVATPAFDLNALLQQIKPGQSQQQQQSSMTSLDQTIAALSQQQQQQQQQQPQQQPLGGTGLDLSKLLAVVNAQNQLRAQQQSQFPAPAPATQAGTPNLAALLAQMQGQAAPQPAYPHMPALPVGISNPNPYPGPDNEYSRKHGRNDPAADDHDRVWNKKKKAGGAGGIGSQNKNHPNFKTVVCKFWQEGKCLKGDDCTFRHDEGLN